MFILEKRQNCGLSSSNDLYVSLCDRSYDRYVHAPHLIANVSVAACEIIMFANQLQDSNRIGDFW